MHQQPTATNAPADALPPPDPEEPIPLQTAGVTPSKPSKSSLPPLYIPPGHTAFRLLCHASRVGGLIGKSGSTIKHLQQITNSKIRVHDPIDATDHRVITVVASAAVAKKIKISNSSSTSSTATTSTTNTHASSSSSSEEEIEVGNGSNTGVLDEECFDVSAAQEGVLRVFERVVEVAAEGDWDKDGEGDALPAIAVVGVVSCRLLAWKNQAGAVIGKGGKVVERIRKETGCRVKVLASDKYLPRSSPSEEIVEIEGNFLAVRKALVAVTSRLQEFPPFEKSRMYGTRSPVTEHMPTPSVDSSPQQSHLLQQVHPNSASHVSGGSLQSLEADEFSSVGSETPKLEVVFKILCPNGKVGSIIGKGGSIIKALEKETGASINFGPVLTDCDDRLITITAMESVESQDSPAQKAAVLVFNRSMVAGLVKGLDSYSKGPVSARVAVASSQVGCLLGKGGAIISKMRKETGASLRIVGGDQLPKCALQNDEVVQITGEFASVQNALYKVTSRLRMNMFSMKMSNGGWNSSSSRIEGGSAYSGVSDTSLSGSHLSVGISENVNERKYLTSSMDHRGTFNHVDRLHSPSLLPTLRVSSVNKENVMDTSERLHLVKGVEELTISGGSGSAIETNTAVEIVVSDNVIGSIYGENGSNLARLREISGANVIVHEACPGTTQRTVVLYGTPDQTRAAQSLLHAFILAAGS